MRLNGKTALITGAAGDIGAATARRFGEEGAQLALIDLDRDGVAGLAKDLASTPLTLETDVTDENAVRAAADQVKTKFSGLDILFVNAGVEQSHTPLVDMTTEAFERVVKVNLMGAFQTAKAFLPLMNDNASVIFTSSIAALMPLPAYSAYSASKAAVIGMMRSVSLDVAARQIRCNTIHPGPVKSRMLARSAREVMGETGDANAFYDAATSAARIARLVEPEEVASLALFLASDESRMITGQSICVDGGMVQ